MVGVSLWTVGWVLYAIGGTFDGIALAEIVLGAGHAFVSGADAALLFSSLDAAGEIGAYRRWEGRVRAAGQACEAASSAAGGWLYATAPRLPIWLQIPVALAAVAVAVAHGRRGPARGGDDRARGADVARLPPRAFPRASPERDAAERRARPVHVRHGVADPAVDAAARHPGGLVRTALGRGTRLARARLPRERTHRGGARRPDDAHRLRAARGRGLRDAFA